MKKRDYLDERRRKRKNPRGMVYEMHEIDDALDGEKATSILEKTKNNFNAGFLLMSFSSNDILSIIVQA